MTKGFKEEKSRLEVKINEKNGVNDGWVSTRYEIPHTDGRGYKFKGSMSRAKEPFEYVFDAIKAGRIIEGFELRYITKFKIIQFICTISDDSNITDRELTNIAKFIVGYNLDNILGLVSDYCEDTDFVISDETERNAAMLRDWAIMHPINKDRELEKVDIYAILVGGALYNTQKWTTVNHYTPYVFTQEMFERLLKAAEPYRVADSTSSGGRRSHVVVDEYEFPFYSGEEKTLLRAKILNFRKLILGEKGIIEHFTKYHKYYNPEQLPLIYPSRRNKKYEHDIALAIHIIILNHFDEYAFLNKEAYLAAFAQDIRLFLDQCITLDCIYEEGEDNGVDYEAIKLSNQYVNTFINKYWDNIRWDLLLAELKDAVTRVGYNGILDYIQKHPEYVKFDDGIFNRLMLENLNI